MIPDLPAIADAMKAHPDIMSVCRRAPDDLVTRETWTVRLQGGWLADHAGCGETIEEAYANAVFRMADLKLAA